MGTVWNLEELMRDGRLREKCGTQVIEDDQGRKWLEKKCCYDVLDKEREEVISSLCLSPCYKVEAVEISSDDSVIDWKIDGKWRSKDSTPVIDLDTYRRIYNR